MNIFKKLIVTIIRIGVTVYAMYGKMSMLIKHDRKMRKLSNNWSEKGFEQVENVRQFYLLRNGHFENLLILLYELYYFRVIHEDPKRYKQVMVQLRDLKSFFEQSEENVSSLSAQYIPSKENSVNCVVDNLYLVYLYDRILERANDTDYFMDYETALTAYSALHLLSRFCTLVNYTKVIELYFNQAQIFGFLKDIDRVCFYYNKAYQLAVEHGDDIYKYRTLVRKLTLFITIKDFGIHDNWDAERQMTIETMDKWCEEKHLSMSALGEQLKAGAEQALRHVSGMEKKVLEMSIAQLDLSINWVDTILEIRQEDEDCIVSDTVKMNKAKQQIYGTYFDDGVINVIKDMYLSRPVGDSDKQMKKLDCDLGEDNLGILVPEISQDMLPIVKFTQLLSYAQINICNGDIRSASICIRLLYFLSKEYKSDFLKAISYRLYSGLFIIKHNEKKSIYWLEQALQVIDKNDRYTAFVDVMPFFRYIVELELASVLVSSNPERALTILDGLLKQKKVMFNSNRKLEILQLRAQACHQLGDKEAVEQSCMEMLDIALTEIRHRLPFMENEARNILWEEMTLNIRSAFKYLQPESSAAFRTKSYDAVLVAKGFMLQAERVVARTLQEENDLQELGTIYAELQKNEAHRRAWTEGSEHQSSLYSDYFFKEAKLTNALNKVISKHFTFIDEDYAAVREYLKEKQVVVDYFDYELENGDIQYFAFVFRSGQASPEVVPVCKESELQTIYDQLAAEKLPVSELYNPSKPYAAELVDKVWTPVAHSRIAPGDEVFFIPSGSLLKIAIESLPASRHSRGLLSDGYASFVRLSHLRELSHRGHTLQPRRIELFGGLHYGRQDDTAATTRSYGLHSDFSGPTPLLPWLPLEGTYDEVMSIQSLCVDKLPETKVVVHTAEAGGVAEFCKLSGASPDILHLATHGFCETMANVEHLPVLKGQFRPMDLSGIVLSRGNEGWLHGNSHEHTGILTAAEISRMDLSDTQLVVLSACYTGDGKVKSDGVFGLQRAFKKAGAQTLVMSLWNEYDFAGCEMMQLFYGLMFNKGMAPHEAFLQAKNIMRESYVDPAYWAGFIMLD